MLSDQLSTDVFFESINLINLVDLKKINTPHHRTELSCVSIQAQASAEGFEEKIWNE